MVKSGWELTRTLVYEKEWTGGKPPKGNEWMGTKENPNIAKSGWELTKTQFCKEWMGTNKNPLFTRSGWELTRTRILQGVDGK